MNERFRAVVWAEKAAGRGEVDERSKEEQLRLLKGYLPGGDFSSLLFAV